MSEQKYKQMNFLKRCIVCTSCIHNALRSIFLFLPIHFLKASDTAFYNKGLWLFITKIIYQNLLNIIYLNIKVTMKIFASKSRIVTSLVYFSVLHLCFFAAYAQEKIQPFERNAISKEGKILYTERGTVSHQKGTNDTIKIKYFSEVVGSVNPHKVAFDYNMVKNKSGYKVDMIAGMDPFLTRINDNVSRTYQGDDLYYPNSMKVGQVLDNASGVFYLNVDKGALTIFNKIEITNRVVQGIESVNYDEQILTAFVVRYNYKYVSGFKETITRTVEETVTEWFIPGYGSIRQERVGVDEIRKTTLASSLKN